MASDAISGIGGTVLEGANVITDVTEWSISKNIGVGSIVSSSTAGWTEKVSGAKDWSGSVGFVCDGGLPTNMPDVGEEVTLALRATGTTTIWSGTAIIESIEINLGVNEEPIGGTMTFQGSGVLTET